MSNPAITAALIAASRQQEVEEAIEGRQEGQGHRAVERHIAQPRRSKGTAGSGDAAGTVKTTGDGRHYLNERAIADRKEGQGFMVVLILLVIASILASGLVLLKTAGN